MRGHIRKRGDAWSVIVEAGRDADGRRVQKWVTIHGTRRDAERERTRLLREIDTGTFVEPSRLTLGEYLERWLADYAQANVSAKTYERYQEIVRLHLVPALGALRLPKVAPLHIQSYYTKALKEGRRDGKGGLSPQTVVHHHRVLHGALGQAVKWQLLSRNPAAAVEVPRAIRPEMRVLDESETARLLVAARGTALYVPVILAVTTGLRRGELLALRWGDVAPDMTTLSVHRSLEQTTGGIAFKEPKTRSSRRTVSLPALTTEALKAHRAEQARRRLLLGPGYQDDDLILPRLNGEPWPPDSFSAAFGDLIRPLGLGHVRLHDLRHSHATQLARQGVHPKVVSERLGHTNIGVTMDLYSHVFPGMQEGAAAGIDASLRAAMALDNDGT